MAPQVRMSNRFLPSSDDHITRCAGINAKGRGVSVCIQDPSATAGERHGRDCASSGLSRVGRSAWPVLSSMCVGKLTLLVLVCAFVQFSLISPCPAAEKWLIYIDPVLARDLNLIGDIQIQAPLYAGYYEFPDPIRSIDTAKGTRTLRNTFLTKAQQVYEALKRDPPDITPGKPVINKKDDAYVILLHENDMGLVCTKQDESFKQVDAAVVPPTIDSIAVPKAADTKELTETKVDVNAFPCDLETRDKGNTKITYTIEKKLPKKENSASASAPTPETKAAPAEQPKGQRSDTRIPKPTAPRGSQTKNRDTDLDQHQDSLAILPGTKDKKVGAKSPTQQPAPGNNDAASQKAQENKQDSSREGGNEIVLKEAVRVHELYRFRITSGPVFSSLIRKNKSFSVITNSSGQQEISSSKSNDAPVNFPVFMKCYCFSKDGRDILVDPHDWYSLERFSPIVGINLVDNPLKNFYTGLSYEPVLGVDLIGGMHFAKLTQLTGGLAEGPVQIGTMVATTNKFHGGWFVGVTVDVGVVGSWLGSQVTKTIKEGLR